jgi:hypothetical protein
VRAIPSFARFSDPNVTAPPATALCVAWMPNLGLRMCAFFDSSPTSRRKSMRLRRNQSCPIHRSLCCCGRETVSKMRSIRQMGVQRIDDLRIIPVVIVNSVPMLRCGNCSIARSWRRTENAGSARTHSRTTTTSCQTISIPKAWEEPGEMITLTISRLCIGGAMEKRDQAGYRNAS